MCASAGDQAETALLRFARASGLDGLAGIAARRELPTSTASPAASQLGVVPGDGGADLAGHVGEQRRPVVRVVRPLLWAHKGQLQQLLKRCGLNWVEDPTNRDTTYARNFVRELPGMMAAAATEQPCEGGREDEAPVEGAEVGVVAGLQAEGTNAWPVPEAVADLIRVQQACAAALHVLQQNAAQFMHASVIPLQQTDSCHVTATSPANPGCLLDLAVLTKAQHPVLRRVLSAVLQVSILQRTFPDCGSGMFSQLRTRMLAMQALL